MRGAARRSRATRSSRPSGRPGAPAAVGRPCGARSRSRSRRTRRAADARRRSDRSSSASAVGACVATTARVEAPGSPSASRTTTPSAVARRSTGRGRETSTADGSRASSERTYSRLPPTTVRQRWRRSPSIPWLRKNRIPNAAGNASASLGRGRPERGGHRDEVVASGTRPSSPRPAGTRSKSLPSTSASPAVRRKRRISPRSRPARHGRRLDHATPQRARHREAHHRRPGRARRARRRAG